MQSGFITANFVDLDIEKFREDQSRRRAKIVLWKRPVTTIHYFIRELFVEAKKLAIG